MNNAAKISINKLIIFSFEDLPANLSIFFLFSFKIFISFFAANA